MKNLTKIALATAALTVSAAGFAGGSNNYAAPKNDSGFYVGLTGGMNFIKGGTKDSKYSDRLKTGWNLGGAVGYQMNKNISGEFSYYYLRNAATDAANAIYAALGTGANTKGHMSQNLFMLNGYYTMPVGSGFGVFAGAGLGLGHGKTYFKGDTTHSSDSKTAFATQLIAGANYTMGNIGFGLSYHFAPVFYGKTNGGTAYNNMLNADLSYKF